MKTKHLFYLSTIALSLSITSCDKDVPDPDTVLPNSTAIGKTYTNGVFITNEGTFGLGTGTLSFYSKSDASVSNEIFFNKNAYTLGNILQSMNIYNGKGYLVVNNADKIEVVDGNTIESKGIITGLSKPRYFLGINASKAYVSQWGSTSSSIAVVDLVTNMVTSTIATGNGAENMLLLGNKVYVTCSGGLGADSVVNVINSTTNAVIKTIKVGANPRGIKVDTNGDIWVMCSGKWKSDYSALENTGSLLRIDATADTVNLSLPFSSTSSQPSNLVINNAKTSLFYTYSGAVYSHDITSTTLSSSAIINRSFYALGIDPTNDYFYGSDAGDYSSNGKVIRYKSAGMVVDSFSVGVIPGGFYFK